MKSVETIIERLNLLLTPQHEADRMFKYEMISDKQQAEADVRCERRVIRELLDWITKENGNAEKE